MFVDCGDRRGGSWGWTKREVARKEGRGRKEEEEEEEDEEGGRGEEEGGGGRRRERGEQWGCKRRVDREEMKENKRFILCYWGDFLQYTYMYPNLKVSQTLPHHWSTHTCSPETLYCSVATSSLLASCIITHTYSTLTASVIYMSQQLPVHVCALFWPTMCFQTCQVANMCKCVFFLCTSHIYPLRKCRLHLINCSKQAWR